MALGTEHTELAPSSATTQRQPSLVDLSSPAQAKVALFRSFFRGRENVYARRFESPKTSKSGYAPACTNEMNGYAAFVASRRSSAPIVRIGSFYR